MFFRLFPGQRVESIIPSLTSTGILMEDVSCQTMVTSFCTSFHGYIYVSIQGESSQATPGKYPSSIRKDREAVVFEASV